MNVLTVRDNTGQVVRSELCDGLGRIEVGRLLWGGGTVTLMAMPGYQLNGHRFDCRCGTCRPDLYVTSTWMPNHDPRGGEWHHGRPTELPRPQARQPVRTQRQGPLGRPVNRWVSQRRKALAIAALGLAEVAAYIIADPGELPKWVVTAAAAVNVLGVYWMPRNAQPVRREDLARKVDYLSQPTRHVRRERDDRPGTIP